ncbi:MAG TPA: type II toxin-antitoxin system VapC family toxin [Thermoanaerobaculia bacterium]
MLQSVLQDDPNIAVSFITPVEVASAVWRQFRQTRDDVAWRRAELRYAALQSGWTVIDEYEAALTEARRLISRHRLRAADAIQLACARVSGDTLPVVTLDKELAAAARAEGFPVLTVD